jgi:hypothetical protein
MDYPAISKEEISQLGHNLYEARLRSQVETDENIGQIIAIDVNTGDYEIDGDLLAACHRLKVHRPDATTWIARIGYDSVYAIGGTRVRTSV